MEASPRRRKRLVEKGGVEAFEIRVVVWFDGDGRSWTSLEVSTPEGHGDPHLVEMIGALEVAKASILEGQE